MIFSLANIGEMQQKSLGKKPNHKNMTKTKFSAFRKWRMTAHVREKCTQQIQNREFHTQQIPNRLREPQRGWMMMMKIPKSSNSWRRTYHRQNRGGENNSQASLREEKWRTWMYGQMGMHFGCLLAPKVKNVFPQIRISCPYSSHPRAITTSTNFRQNYKIGWMRQER